MRVRGSDGVVTRHRTMRQRLTRIAFLVWSLITGRIYYDDGTSERSSRRWVWKALGPHPDLWPCDHPWLGERDECGCVRWRVTHRPAIWCMDHPEGDEFVALMRDAMTAAEATTTTTSITVDPTDTVTNSTAVFVFPTDEDHA